MMLSRPPKGKSMRNHTAYLTCTIKTFWFNMSMFFLSDYVLTSAIYTLTCLLMKNMIVAEKRNFT